MIAGILTEACLELLTKAAYRGCLESIIKVSLLRSNCEKDLGVWVQMDDGSWVRTSCWQGVLILLMKHILSEIDDNKYEDKVGGTVIVGRISGRECLCGHCCGDVGRRFQEKKMGYEIVMTVIELLEMKYQLEKLFGHPHCERTNARHVRSGHSRLGFLGKYVLELAMYEFFMQSLRFDIKKWHNGGTDDRYIYTKNSQTAWLWLLLCRLISDKDGFVFGRELMFLLLSSYGATVGEKDTGIYKIMQDLKHLEKSTKNYVANMDYLWGTAAIRVRKEREIEHVLSSDDTDDNEKHRKVNLETTFQLTSECVEMLFFSFFMTQA
ncbi:hypothetical protein Tco_0937972 [Tanacetum coccineum]|uniref:Uncharacterized protein n=1 Tax=Tanacetum coccineum TaxID=301880 RepID=A0ABQ5DGS8_9ASTR